MKRRMRWVRSWGLGTVLGAAMLACPGLALAEGEVSAPPVSPTSAYATKGIVEVEGGISFNYRRLDHNNSATTLTLSPAIRTFVMNRLAVGALFQLQVIEHGPTTFRLLPQAEYSVNMGRLFPYVGLGAGIDYTKSGGHSSTDFALEPGAGVKLVFGGGLVGLGLQIPILFGNPLNWGLDILTRYAVFF